MSTRYYIISPELGENIRYYEELDSVVLEMGGSLITHTSDERFETYSTEGTHCLLLEKYVMAEFKNPIDALAFKLACGEVICKAPSYYEEVIRIEI